MELLTNLRAIFQTSGPVVIYPASGTGAWEAALANTLSPGDTVLMCRTGWFATLWNEMANQPVGACAPYRQATAYWPTPPPHAPVPDAG